MGIYPGVSATSPQMPFPLQDKPSAQGQSLPETRVLRDLNTRRTIAGLVKRRFDRYLLSALIREFAMRRWKRVCWYAVLLVPFVGALWIPFYNRIDPALFGIPFFYWFQFVWIIVTAVITAAAYLAKA